MIRHIILFKIKWGITLDEVDAAINAMCDLQNQLPGIASIVAGECYFLDEKSTDFFGEGVSHGMSIDFKDQAALNSFFKDPIAHPAKDAIVKIAEGGYEGIIGFDFVNKHKLIGRKS